MLLSNAWKIGAFKHFPGGTKLGPFALLMSYYSNGVFSGSTANLMSPWGSGKLLYGMLVDSAVVMVEHITAELGNPKHKREL